MEAADSKLEIGTESVYDYLRRQDADVLTDKAVYTKSITGPCQDEFFSRKDCPFETELRHFVSLIQQKTGDL